MKGLSIFLKNNFSAEVVVQYDFIKPWFGWKEKQVKCIRQFIEYYTPFFIISIRKEMEFLFYLYLFSLQKIVIQNQTNSK